MIPVVLYLRMSDGKQETSVPEQRKACQKYAKAQGLRIVREYLDSGISGDATEKRVEFQRMIRDAAKGEFRGVLCWDQDRFGRFDPLEAGYWIKPLRDAGVFLETVGQGRIDWNDFAGRIVYSVQQEGKHAYLRDLSRNVNRGMLAAALEGRVLAAVPFGYVVTDGKVRIDEPAAETIRELFGLYLAGQSCREVALALNARALPSMSGGPWSRTTVYQALVKEFYAGVYVWNRRPEGKYSGVTNGAVVAINGARGRERSKDDAIRIEDHHPAIVTKRQFARVREMLTDNRKTTFPKRSSGGFALSGLLVCGACGASMHGRRSRGKPFYVCSRSLRSSDCRSHAASESEALELILARIAEFAADEKFLRRAVERHRQIVARSSSASNRAALERRLTPLESKIRQAETRLMECDAEFLPTVQAGLRRLTAEALEVRQQIAELEAAKATASSAESDLRRIGQTARQLVTQAAQKVPGRIRAELAKIVRRAVLHSVESPRHASRFVLVSAEIELILGARLQATASRRKQVCIIKALMPKKPA